MNSKLIISLALFTSSASGKLFSSSIGSQKYLWENFKSEFKKEFASHEEHDYRFNIFLDNLKLIDERNEKDTATHGITKFADMSSSEFKMTHLNYQPELYSQRNFDSTIEPINDNETSFIDWTGIYTTPVKDQGYCGSCWAFSATEQIESDYMRQFNHEEILSVQQINSCTKYFIAGGCNGGSTEKAFTYATNGLQSEIDYPYTSGNAGITGSCKSNSNNFIVKAIEYKTISNSPKDESKMASYISSTGPLSVCVDASSWSSYTGGILSTCGTDVDHCVQLVGMNIHDGYWKVRNSWGTSWGESGFIRLAYGANTCAITSDANYVITAAV